MTLKKNFELFIIMNVTLSGYERGMTSSFFFLQVYYDLKIMECYILGAEGKPVLSILNHTPPLKNNNKEQSVENIRDETN